MLESDKRHLCFALCCIDLQHQALSMKLFLVCILVAISVSEQTAQCFKDWDCPDPRCLCVGGTCIENAVCRTDCECRDGLKCVNGQCVTCASNTDCARGQICSRGQCMGTGGCTAYPWQCPLGQVCRNGACVGCLVSSECLGRNCACYNNRCVCPIIDPYPIPGPGLPIEEVPQ